MSLDLDKVLFTSTLPSFIEVDKGTFTVPISGTIASAAFVTFTASKAVDITKGSIRISASQNIVAVDVATDYSAGDRVSIPSFGNGIYSPFLTNPVSVAGDPSVTSLTIDNTVNLDGSSINVTMRIDNPYAGTATLTPTIFTFYYSITAPTYVV